MDFTGLLSAYPKQRKLTAQERSHQLKQTQRLNLDPNYQLSVIKMNSTFLESVDKWYSWKGVITAVSLSLIFIFAYGLAMVGFGSNTVPWREMNDQERLEQVIFSAYIALISLPFIVGGAWLLKKESFAYTHYPIRLNFRTRMVHVFRKDGSIMSAPWDHIFFTLGHLPAWDEWEVRGHILESDKCTVRETFALSYVGSINPEDIVAGVENISSADFVRAHWEFVRRYMEEGPESVLSQIQFCMPVDKQREGMRISLERILANIAGAPVFLYCLLAPFCTVVFFFRVIAMRTSKTPVWSNDVEASSSIEHGDPFAIEGNLKGDRVALFPDAASAAGVSFRPTAKSKRKLPSV